MDLNQLKIFCAVVERKSFSRASEAIFLSQPTVSFQIKSLEDELGTMLLDRRGRGVTTTRSGKELYKYARRILQLSNEAIQSIEQLKGLIKGELAIGASNIPGEYILPKMLAEFKRIHSGIDINLVIGDSRDIVEKVLDNEVEIGVVGTKEKEDSRLIYDSFTTDRLVLVCPVTFSLFKQDVITAKELKNVPFVLREGGSGTRATVKHKLQEIGIKENELDVVMRLGSTSAVKKAVESGAGVSLISERSIENELKAGSLKKISIKDIEFAREFFIIYKRRKSHSPATKSLLQFLEEKKN
jgi:DNA-binding transcriptional LysR family regulator